METSNALDKLFYEVNVKLGGTSVIRELEEADYEIAFDEAVRVYRAMSSNSVKRGFYFFKLQPGQQKYQMPEEIDNIREIRRSRSGVIVGESFEPFSASFIQQTFQGTNSQGYGGFATYDFMAQFQKTAGRLFGEYILHYYNESTNELSVFILPKVQETVAIDCSYLKSIDELLKNGQSYRWLRQYTEGMCRKILGEKYSKIQNLPGAQGGTQLNGSEMLQSGNDMCSAAEQEILDFVDGGEPYIPHIG